MRQIRPVKLNSRTFGGGKGRWEEGRFLVRVYLFDGISFPLSVVFAWFTACYASHVGSRKILRRLPKKKPTLLRLLFKRICKSFKEINKKAEASCRLKQIRECVTISWTAGRIVMFRREKEFWVEIDVTLEISELLLRSRDFSIDIQDFARELLVAVRQIHSLFRSRQMIGNCLAARNTGRVRSEVSGE